MSRTSALLGVVDLPFPFLIDKNSHSPFSRISHEPDTIATEPHTSVGEFHFPRPGRTLIMAEHRAARPDDKFDHRDIAASNVAGSTAGASSGDFHVYRHHRRKELDRIERMEREAKEKEEAEARVKDETERKQKEEMQTQKRATKRKRKKELRNERKKQRAARRDVAQKDNKANEGPPANKDGEKSDANDVEQS